MSHFPITRLSLSRLFVLLATLSLPRGEGYLDQELEHLNEVIKTRLHSLRAGGD